MDMDSARENLEEFKKKVKEKVFPISALNNEGIDDALIEIANKLDETSEEPLYSEDNFESHVLYKFKEEPTFEVYKDNDVYVVTGEKIEKLLKMTKFTDEGARRFANKLRKMGVDDRLREMGIQEGDYVRILDYEFEFRE